MYARFRDTFPRVACVEYKFSASFDLLLYRNYYVNVTYRNNLSSAVDALLITATLMIKLITYLSIGYQRINRIIALLILLILTVSQG